MPGAFLAERSMHWLQVKDPGASGSIKATKSNQYVGLVSAAAEARTLARPFTVGNIITLQMKTDGGDITLTVTGGYNELGSTSLVFNDAGQIATFVAVDIGGTKTWRLIYTDIPGATTEGPRYVAVPDADTAILALNSGKVHIVANVGADRTFTLPAAAAGLDFTFIPDITVADGHDWIISTGSDTNYFTGGVVHLDSDAGAATDELVLVSPDGNSNSKLQVNLPEPGTLIRAICTGTLWTLSGYAMSATAPTFADQ